MSCSGFEGLHLHFILHSMNDVTREASVTLVPLRDGVMELAVSMFWGFWARCARDRPRRPSPRLSILMQTRSLSTQRGYISHTKDVLSPDTTHKVSDVLIQSCFVSLFQSVWVLSGTGLEQWGIHTHKHTRKHPGGVFRLFGHGWYDVWIKDEDFNIFLIFVSILCNLMLY